MSFIRLLTTLSTAAAIFVGGAVWTASADTTSEATRRLFDAVRSGDLGAVQASVGDGANLQAVNISGIRAVDLAVDRGRFDIAHYLLSVMKVKRQQAEAKKKEPQSPPPAAPVAAAPPPVEPQAAAPAAVPPPPARTAQPAEDWYKATSRQAVLPVTAPLQPPVSPAVSAVPPPPVQAPPPRKITAPAKTERQPAPPQPEALAAAPAPAPAPPPQALPARPAQPAEKSEGFFDRIGTFFSPKPETSAEAAPAAPLKAEEPPLPVAKPVAETAPVRPAPPAPEPVVETAPVQPAPPPPEPVVVERRPKPPTDKPLPLQEAAQPAEKSEGFFDRIGNFFSPKPETSAEAAPAAPLKAEEPPLPVAKPVAETASVRPAPPAPEPVVEIAPVQPPQPEPEPVVEKAPVQPAPPAPEPVVVERRPEPAAEKPLPLQETAPVEEKSESFFDRLGRMLTPDKDSAPPQVVSEPVPQAAPAPPEPAVAEVTPQKTITEPKAPAAKAEPQPMAEALKAEPEAVPARPAPAARKAEAPSPQQAAEPPAQMPAVAPPAATAPSPQPESGGFFSRLADIFSPSKDKTSEPAEPQETARAVTEQLSKQAEQAEAAPAAPAKAPPQPVAVKAAPQTASVAPARRPPPPVPDRALRGVRLAIATDMALGRAKPEKATSPCIVKKRGKAVFCVEKAEWPAGLTRLFNITTKYYRGSQIIVRYDEGRASQYHALFGAGDFKTIADYLTIRYGPPTHKPEIWTPFFGEPRRKNTTHRWVSVDNAGDTSILEIRQIDDLRWSSLPDRKHGLVRLYRPGAKPVFRLLSLPDFMLHARQLRRR